MIKTHGMSGTRPYRNWAAMRNRCNNPNDEGYKNYGGRGIYKKHNIWWYHA
jgi:hypothetical protein